MSSGVLLMTPLSDVFSSISGAIDFVFDPGAHVRPGVEVDILGHLYEHLKVSGLALAMSLTVAFPIGLFLGHRGAGQLWGVAIGNAGRALPELVLIAALVAFVGVGLVNVAIALAILGVPPILTNTFIGIRQVDPTSVEAAEGMGMSGSQVLLRVELPLAVPTIMSGVRTAALNIVATATIAPLAGVLTLGDYILGRNVFTDDGVLAGGILVAALALTVELLLAMLQRLLTPRGLRLQAVPASA
jgi:osmoprotectant transport system permease protein